MTYSCASDSRMIKLSPTSPIYPNAHSKNITSYFSSLKSRANALPRHELNEPSPHVAYFICFTNRCGSNYVAQTMASDGRLVQACESFNYGAVINKSRRNGFGTFYEYVDWLKRTQSGTVGIFGCKASAGQLIFLFNEGILSTVAPSIKFIHVVRRDTLAQAVSHYIADRTKQWNSTQRRNHVEIVYDRGELLRIANLIRMQNAMFDTLFRVLSVERKVVYYEDFVGYPAETIRQIGEFIGLPDLCVRAENVHYKQQSSELNARLIGLLRNELRLH